MPSPPTALPDGLDPQRLETFRAQVLEWFARAPQEQPEQQVLEFDSGDRQQGPERQGAEHQGAADRSTDDQRQGPAQPGAAGRRPTGQRSRSEQQGIAGRPLPWRTTRDPYRVLVAEVLAQQTQAERAAAGYERFLERFPDPETLAAAAPSEVLRVWQGMGYNRRALALRAAAAAVVERGGWPSTVEELERLPGVGPYTARAVACFAFEQPVAPVDTNVARVLARGLLGMDPADLPAGRRQRLADAALPPEHPWAWSSALMDLGAGHCRPKPHCTTCPVALSCAWRALGAAAPRSRPRRQQPFATSDRRWRGAVVRVLAATPEGMDAADLSKAVDAAAAGRDDGWFATLLQRLTGEGLVERGDDGRFRLPGG